MTEIYYDGDLGVFKDSRIAIIGYGNQGRSQALNLRDSGLQVIVGNAQDESWAQAEKDEFEIFSVADAARRADVIMLLLPDEVAPQVYREAIVPHLQEGKVLEFASGYNIAYGFIQPPAGIDVILVAPRMVGRFVRELFVEGKGAPALIGVHQDASGGAKDKVLALAKGIGATGAGAVWSSFEEETLADLFGEQMVGGILHLTRLGYEVMREAGISEEAAMLELTLSGEMSEIYKAVGEVGLWEQLKLHSRTSQYGQQTRGRRMATPETVQVLRAIMEEIRDGSFAREWCVEQMAGTPHFNRLWHENLNHPFTKAEQRVRETLRGKRTAEK